MASPSQNPNIMNKRLVILGFLYFFFFVKVTATTYYVSNSGNNADPGTSDQPFLTIQHATGVVAAGDTVFVRNGSYAGFDHRTNSGTAGDPIVYYAESLATIIEFSGPIRSDGINVEGVDYIVIDGFTVRNIPEPGNGIRVVLANNCVVRNCVCDNNWNRGIFTGFTDDILIEYNECMNTLDEHGIYVSNSSDRPIIRYNISHDNNNIGIHMNGDLSAGGDGIISDAQVYGNIIYENNQAAGINMDGVENALIYNNLIYNNHSAQGIALFQIDGAIPSRGARIFHNTIIVPSDGRWGILMVDGANNGTEIKNNIIINFHSFRGSITTEDVTNLSSDFNILSDKMSSVGDGSSVPLANWQLLGLDLNSMIADPWTAIFSDPVNADFTLLSGSQAINSGTVTSIIEDINLDLRDIVPDIGAFEFDSSLPIILEKGLAGIVTNNAIRLSWKIHSFYNTESLELEKHIHNDSWINLISYPAESMVNGMYSYLDSNPVTGINTYRLIENSLDGNRRILDEASIKFISSDYIGIWPNPATDKLHLRGDLSVLSTLRIYDICGRLYYNSSRREPEILISDFPSGTYIVAIYYQSGYAEHLKLIIQ